MSQVPPQYETDLSLLKPSVRRMAEALVRECKDAGFAISIVRGFRTIKDQDALYAQGRTVPGSIVTRKRGGYSFHNFGVAFDIRPVAASEEEKLALYKKAGDIGKRLGLEWGGDWTEFVDMPHFYYTSGYAIDDFREGKVDEQKFQ